MKWKCKMKDMVVKTTTTKLFIFMTTDNILEPTSTIVYWTNQVIWDMFFFSRSSMHTGFYQLYGYTATLCMIHSQYEYSMCRLVVSLIPIFHRNRFVLNENPVVWALWNWLVNFLVFCHRFLDPFPKLIVNGRVYKLNCTI